MSAGGSLLTLGAGSSPQTWPNAPREPLPPWPHATGSQPPAPEASCWSANGDYAVALSTAVPDHPDRIFHRGNFCGVRVPGLTEGGNDKDPSLTITWDWTSYSELALGLSIDWYGGGCGYTHPVLSIPQTLNQGKTLDDLRHVLTLTKAADMSNVVVACSDGNPFYTAEPWLDALYHDGLIDVLCVGWQVDKYYAEQDIVQLLIDASAWANPRGLPVTVHWGGGYPGWAESCACWNDITEAKWGIHDRFSFQAFFASICAQPGHYGQCNTEASIDAVQSWIYKVIIAFPPQMFFVAAEMDAQAEYDAPHERLERWGDLKGRLACASPNPNGVSISYLNGARRENGVVL